MARSPFSVFNRPGKDGKARYLARFFDTESGSVQRTIAFEEEGKPVRSRLQALRLAARMHQDGVGVGPDNDPLGQSRYAGSITATFRHLA